VPGYWEFDIRIYSVSRHPEPGRDHHRRCRGVRHVQLEETAWLDCRLPCYDGPDQRDRVLFPRGHLLPSHVVGIISLVVLALAILALYLYHLAGSRRWVYVASSVLALYLNVFVLVVQAFQKVPSLNALAPTQSEPPSIIAQVVVMVALVVLGIVAVRSFHLKPSAPVLRAAT
jgi:hypothetical protein